MRCYIFFIGFCLIVIRVSVDFKFIIFFFISDKDFYIYRFGKFVKFSYCSWFVVIRVSIYEISVVI